MRTLSTIALMEAWERGLGRSLSQRALALLVAGWPEASTDRLARLPIGQRDRHLLSLRELTFGAQLSARAVCPSCRAQLELTFSTSEVPDGTRGREDVVADDALDRSFAVSLDGEELEYRLPTIGDLAAIDGEPDVSRARGLLLERCVVAVRAAGRAVPLASASPALLNALVEHMSQNDPQGDVQMAFRCMVCGSSSLVAFDIASFFWTEVHAWALRTLRDVHTLASAYGWREADILSMTPQRRQLYLELVGS
jgi:hypothetical protein